MSDTKPTASAGLSRAALGLVGAFVISGTLHLLRPEPFEAMVPQLLPARRALVYVSGVAEIACAVGLLMPSTRRVAGVASAGLLAGVFPANVTMARQAKRGYDLAPVDGKRRGYLAATLIRLPLQWPMIRTALRAAGVPG